MGKTKRPTSWQRRRARKAEAEGVTEAKASNAKPKPVSEEAMLNAACAAAKHASEDARRRYREHQKPEPDDEAPVHAVGSHGLRGI